MALNRRTNKNAKITLVQKKHLLDYAAGAGENYEAYLRFCAKFNIPTFTKGYWRQFLQRNRRILQELRKGHVAAVAAEARLGRKNRIALLEDDIARIEKIFETQFEELTVDQVQKMMDQKRKTLEAIAKEMNEWLQKDDDAPLPYSAEVTSVAAQKWKELQAAAAESPVEAEFEDVTEASSA